MSDSEPLTEPLIESDSYSSSEEQSLPLRYRHIFLLSASFLTDTSLGVAFPSVLDRSTLQGYAPPSEDAELSDSVEESIDQRGKSGTIGAVILGVFVATFDIHVGAVDTRNIFSLTVFPDL